MQEQLTTEQIRSLEEKVYSSMTLNTPKKLSLREKFLGLFKKKLHHVSGEKLTGICDKDTAALISKPSGEVITPYLDSTAEDISGLVSQAACDHEFPRIIVYPIDPEVRKEVIQMVKDKPEMYPMFEYRLAELVTSNGEIANSNTLIYKYQKQSYDFKPI